MRAYRGRIYLALALFAGTAAAAYGQAGTFPDAPSATQAATLPATLPAKKASYWTVYPHRTNAETLRARTFYIPEAAALASNVWDAEMTHAGIGRHKCVERQGELPAHPSRGQLYTYDLVPYLVMGGLDFVVHKYLWAPDGLIAPAYGIAVHLRGGIGWAKNCW
jgi:hypothetical protein